MLLQHAWLKPLVKPSIIIEEEEESESESPVTPSPAPSDAPVPPETSSVSLPPDVVDKEVAEWVSQAIELRRSGKLGKVAKPALHAAPLDAVSSPGGISEQKKSEAEASEAAKNEASEAAKNEAVAASTTTEA
jgi:mitogen-activated protein kinase kinase